MKVEVLAPGGSKEAIYAGMACGADAIYTGTSRFSARAFAENPSVTELCEILDYAHLHGKKIYLTVNTLLTERELENELSDMLEPLYEAGLDAVIVQDYGVLDYIHENFPGLEIHASTQMSFVTGEAMNQLKPYGVTRVVPARELNIAELRDIRQKTDLELEVFVHGALCYCYSGQCLMSKVIGGRSGNRGMCAQPCRLPFETENGKKGYFLSTKDLCTLPQLGQLIDAGVNSFKIEGRMKKPAYTAYTAHLYRLYADAWLSGIKKEDKEIQKDVQKLADIYNRGGFCGGYLFEPSKKNIVFSKKNGHYGVCVGEVTKVNKHTVEYQTTAETQYQDVLEFRDNQENSVYEYTVKEGATPGEIVTARFKPGSPLKKGQKVYRTKNNELLTRIETQIGEGQRNQKEAIEGVFTARLGEAIQLVVRYGEYETIVTDVVAEVASKQPVAGEEVERRLKKTGDSSFYFQELFVEVEDNLFFPMGRISALRRQAFEQLQEEILQAVRREAPTPNRQDSNAELELRESQWNGVVVTVTNGSQIQGVKAAKNVTPDNTRLHLKLDETTPQKWNEFSEAVGEFSYYLSLPAVLRAKNRDKFLEAWNEYGNCFDRSQCVGVIVNSLEALPIIEKMGFQSKDKLAGTGLYVWNQRTRKMYERFGICESLYLAYGRTAVMNTEGCVNLQLNGCDSAGDRKHILITTPKKDEFTVVNYCDYCYNIVYEKEAAWHEPDGLSQMPEIRFATESAEEVRKVLEQWNFLS